MVAPFAGAWIEITVKKTSSFKSYVAPFAGAWIEIKILVMRASIIPVAPFAGAWIEIMVLSNGVRTFGSLRSPERGLK